MINYSLDTVLYLFKMRYPSKLSRIFNECNENGSMLQLKFIVFNT